MRGAFDAHESHQSMLHSAPDVLYSDTFHTARGLEHVFKIEAADRRRAPPFDSGQRNKLWNNDMHPCSGIPGVVSFTATSIAKGSGGIREDRRGPVGVKDTYTFREATHHSSQSTALLQKYHPPAAPWPPHQHQHFMTSATMP